jgi:LysM repeat protein
MGGLYKIYVRFLVWLGAEPPEGYEHLVLEEKGPTEYVVQAGETIYAIAREVGVPYKLIAQANGIEDYNSIQAGQTLTIPPPDWTPEWEQPTEPEAEPERGAASDREDTESAVAGEAVDTTEIPAEAAIAPPTQEPLPDFGLESTPAVAIQTDAGPAESTEAELLFRYEVQRGDTLSSIARRYGLTLKELVEANDITDPSRIFPGQKLVIPGYMSPKPAPKPVTEPRPRPTGIEARFVYPVASGDTLNAIAKRYGLTVRELIEANDISDPNLLQVGQKLVIPGVAHPPGPSPDPGTGAAPATGIAPGFQPIGSMEAVRAIYLSYFAAGHAEFRQRVFELLETTELNAVVIDAKGDFGWITYPTGVALAHEIGAARPTARDFRDLLAQFKQQGIYTIARVVTFKDNPLATSRPELAVKTKTNTIWQDREELGWADPYLRPVWDYNIQVAVEAAGLGFDEIQFDFLRFPTTSQAGVPFFSQDVTKETRIAAVTGFLSTARGRLNPLGVKIAADTFGYTCWRTDDTVIGQDIDRMGQYLDVLCPMLYPSTFGNGIPGYKFAIAYPYEIVYHSAARAVNRLKPLGCAVRPWIQDFPDYRFDKRTYGRAEIQAQIKGCFDSGSSGFMVWDPRVRYTEDAYAPARELV